MNGFSTYSLPLKYVITSGKYDSEVLEDPIRGAETVKKCLGIQWDIQTDQVRAVPKYNIHGSFRGKALGPD
jgi:hypothetical protein